MAISSKNQLCKTKTFVLNTHMTSFSVESRPDASCNRTIQFIRAQVQKQSPK
jgi:hypothetical protein